VGQLGKLRADWQSAQGRVANPPQAASPMSLALFSRILQNSLVNGSFIEAA